MRLTQDEKHDLMMQYLNEKDIGTRFRQQKATNWVTNEEVYMGQSAKTNLTRANYQLPHVFDTVHAVGAQLGAGADISYETTNDTDENSPEIMKSLWDDDADRYNLQGEVDVSKIEVGIYGRALFKLIPRKDGAHFEAVDSLSFYISPAAKRTAQAQFCGQEFIDKSIGQLEAEADEMGYDKNYLEQIKMGQNSNPVGQNTNAQEESFRKLRMQVLGLNTAEFDKEATIGITEHYTWFKGKQVQMIVAQDMFPLRIVEVSELGLRRNPFYSYATFPRGITFWTTSPADIARDANLAMSTALNQQIDNSTYKNFASMFVKAGSGLKQNSINPRPFGITPVVVPGNERIQDSVMMMVPPDIEESSIIMQTIKQYSDSAAGVGNPTIPKGQLTATQYASVVAKAAQKNDPMRRDFLRCMQEMADEYAWYVSRHLVIPRDVKIYTGTPLTLKAVTTDNFRFVDEFGEEKITDFIAKAVPEETEDENRAIRQAAAIQMYTLFKDDPMLPGQKYLRERVLKEFEISPAEMDKLFSGKGEEEIDNTAVQLMGGGGTPSEESVPGGGAELPNLTSDPVQSAAGQLGQANAPV